jgi:hypothetical protein
LCACADDDAVNKLKAMTADKILHADIRSFADGKRTVVLWDKNMNINSVLAGTAVEFRQEEPSSAEGTANICLHNENKFS